jgi:hypothetical protein
LEPMSIAAYVCIVGGELHLGKVDMSAMQDTPLRLHYLQGGAGIPIFTPSQSVAWLCIRAQPYSCRKGLGKGAFEPA